MMTAPKPSYSCACFYTDNIFIQEFHVHVRYTGEQQFRRDYERVLSSQGCRTSEQFRNVLETIKKEVERRRKLGEESLHRRREISLHYKPLYPEVYVLQILLNELGFVDALTAPLCEKYIEPLTSLLFPDWGGGCLDSHRAFVVKYALQEDLDLSCHYDNAEVTLNVSLGKEFTDGNLYFSDMKEVPVNERTYAEVEHITGQGILHRGQHVHGALPISSGERWNLILWMRASDVRNKCCPMCDNEPVLVKTLGDGDGFTSVREDREQTVDICTLT
ncbi:2-oxoglutarate and iron-dependent oxygenase domain-containing protein 2 isoform X6 [Xenopus tropicalis]|uniref:2-oxoglutarate and iron-dependent oxygenase domain-containing protein 2 n=1 Tax=Xenopus tropicalis TaxID=8364 RepID=A0A6I8S7S4_XENTR|nr:2-oxoglutarate and iron-dependent oxygenase domain-containing protein 2 isoform X6 [Xenopus tropicalis]|eukprot:XP_012819972.1 PREDICTED: 2-oxoglutarate and iron-dependent oxygenase domain-containing protein 2 isoform X7 [Xenopus tropicalis]